MIDKDNSKALLPKLKKYVEHYQYDYFNSCSRAAGNVWVWIGHLYNYIRIVSRMIKH
jgi:hypothetical protein